MKLIMAFSCRCSNSLYKWIEMVLKPHWGQDHFIWNRTNKKMLENLHYRIFISSKASFAVFSKF